MNNKLKLLLISIISILTLTGCKATTPTDVVTEYFKEIKSGKNADVSAYLQESIQQSETTKDSPEEVDPKIEEAMKILTSKLEANVLSEEITENKAVVQVEAKGINFSNVFMGVIGEALQTALNGEELTEEETSNLMLEKVKTSEIETRTGKVNLTKVDKEWKIETDEDLMSLLLGATEQ